MKFDTDQTIIIAISKRIVKIALPTHIIMLVRHTDTPYDILQEEGLGNKGSTFCFKQKIVSSSRKDITLIEWALPVHMLLSKRNGHYNPCGK